jgi:SAM-dependent methyltransferase
MASMDWSTQSGSAPATYDEFLVPALFAPFAERLVEQAEISPGARVLDVACGTGAASRAAARRAGTTGAVTGVDLGEPQLAVARSYAAEEGAAPITYAQSDATSLSVPDAAFDVALCQQGLQFVPDRAAALAEMRRALRPGGRAAIATWTDLATSPWEFMGAALERILDADSAAMIRSPWGLADPSELASLLELAGFEDVSVTPETIECTFATHADFARRAIAATPLASRFASAPADVQDAVAAHTAESLAPHALPDGRLRLPLTTNVALGLAP